MFPSNGSLTRHSLRSTGFPRVEFPGFTATMKCSDALPPFRPRFVAFAWPYHVVRSGFAPTAAERDYGGQELFVR
jgi:hypothetical protein